MAWFIFVQPSKVGTEFLKTLEVIVICQSSPFLYLLLVVSAAFCIPPTFGNAQEPAFFEADGRPAVHGAKKRPRKARLCLDYGKTRFGDGTPYHVVEPDRTITSHEGMDFCKRAGSPVIAPADGAVRWIEQDNEFYGGVVSITTEFSIKPRPGKRRSQIFVEMVHIVPLPNLRRGQRVNAGQLIGHVRKAGMPSIGSEPHVHFAVRWCNDWPTCHLDPNFFWRDGSGKISCFNKSKPIPKGRIVSPVPC